MSGIVSLFEYDIGPILDILPEFKEIWSEERWRQSMPFTPHRDSETVFLRRQPGSRPRDVLHQLASVATRHFAHAPLANAIDAICAFVEGRPARAMLVKLMPGGVITPHADTGIYADATERFHLPIVTNEAAWLEVEGSRFHMPAGVVYALDKHVEHSGGNDGEDPRTHLIVDIFPDSPAVLAG